MQGSGQQDLTHSSAELLELAYHEATGRWAVCSVLSVVFVDHEIRSVDNQLYFSPEGTCVAGSLQCFGYCWRQTNSMDIYGMLSQPALCRPCAIPSLLTLVREDLASSPGSAEAEGWGLVGTFAKSREWHEWGRLYKTGCFVSCRHVSSRHPGDSASFLSFSGTEEYGNGLGAGPGAGTGAGPGARGMEQDSWHMGEQARQSRRN